MEFLISPHPVDYPEAAAAMERRVEDILAGRAPELLWLLEHPPLYTGGTSAKPAGLLDRRFPVYETGRGGEYTYHGPGQVVGYAMLNLKARDMADMRAYVHRLEQWLIATLAGFGIEGFTREGRIGVWVNESSFSPSTEYRVPSTEKKIAAIGVRVRKWVTYHGVSLNVNPDLSHYSGIVPCGITGYGVTSLKEMGVDATMEQVKTVLKRTFREAFGA